ncbi:MAG: hypothetical protein QNJ16_05920 [Rhodobacter sp.]|nr:hypothetical protein [Rhodobacter sp.]
MTPMKTRLHTTGLTLAAGAMSVAGTMASADQVFNDDVIITFSACIGNDCVNGESFGFDTLRLKENNLRIRFQDTSTSASFPTVDWQLIANDSSNGGDSYFAIENADQGRQIFRVDAGAPANSLRVDSAGDVGIGEDNPVLELHVTDGDTPTLRLEQDGSSGFTPQTFDVAANETNFFVRDVTNGSKLSFKIRPGAPDNSVYIDTNGDVGIGTSSVAAGLHVVNNGSTEPGLLVVDTDGQSEIVMNDGSSGDDFKLQLRDDIDAFSLTFAGTGGAEMVIAKTGVVTVGRGNLEVTSGNVVVGGQTLIVPDYVFAPDYELMPLSDLEAFVTANSHLPNVPSAAEVQAGGLNMTEMQLTLLEKVEELTLYTLEQQKTIEALQGRLDALQAD